MKFYSVAVFVSTLLVLHTATAANFPGVGLGYIRRSFEDVSRYQIRETVPDSEDVKTTNPADMGNAGVAPQTTYRVKPQQPDAPFEVTRPEKSFAENSLAPEEMLTDTNDDLPARYPASGTGTVPQTAQTTLPTNVDYPKRKGDGSAFTDFELPEDSDQIPPNSSVSQSSALKKLKMYASMNSVLANIARIPQTVALQIDSVISGLQSTYPSNTNVGAYMMGTRFLLRHPRALKPFDMLDQAGFGRLPDLVSSMPSVFLPMMNAMDRLWDAIVRGTSVVAQRFIGAVSRVSAGASRSFAGVNVARGMDSYSVSVPNLVDLVLKGQLASRLDELFAYLQQRFLGSGLYNVGSTYFGGASNPASAAVSEMSNPPPASTYFGGASNPASARPVPEMSNPPPASDVSDPARKQSTYRMRSNPRFSVARNFYKPFRYFSNSN